MPPRGKPFEKGHAKLGGRAKGTPNKRTQALQEILEANELEIVPRLCAIINGGHLEPKDQAWVLLELMQYLYPKRRAIEVDDKTPDTGKLVLQVAWADEQDEQRNHAPDASQDAGAKKNQ